MTDTVSDDAVRTAAQKVAEFSAALDDLGIIGILRDTLTEAATPTIVGVYLLKVIQ